MLLRSQKNEVLELVVKHGFDPQEFEWNVEKSRHTKEIRRAGGRYGPSGRPEPVYKNLPKRIDGLVHKPSGFYFNFDEREASHFAAFSPGDETQEENHFSGSWSLQRSFVVKWLRYLGREVTAEDMWSTLSGGVVTAQAVQDLESRRLSTEEATALYAGLKQLGRRLEEKFALTAGALERIEHDTAEIAEASSDRSVKEVGFLLMGAVMSWFIADLIPPDTAEAILSEVWGVFTAAIDALSIDLPSP